MASHPVHVRSAHARLAPNLQPLRVRARGPAAASFRSGRASPPVDAGWRTAHLVQYRVCRTRASPPVAARARCARALRRPRSQDVGAQARQRQAGVHRLLLRRRQPAKARCHNFGGGGRGWRRQARRGRGRRAVWCVCCLLCGAAALHPARGARSAPHAPRCCLFVASLARLPSGTAADQAADADGSKQKARVRYRLAASAVALLPAEADGVGVRAPASAELQAPAQARGRRGSSRRRGRTAHRAQPCARSVG